MPSTQISGKQLFWMISTMQVGMTILLTINPAILVAKQDAWISTMIAGAVGVFIAYVCTRISILMPHMTFVEYTKKLLGSWIGNAVVFLYLVQYYVILTAILCQYSDMIIGTVLPQTPNVVPILGMLLVAIYAAGSGLETIARCSQLFGPIILLGVLVPLLLSIKDIQLHHMEPIYQDTGSMLILKGALPTSTFLGDCIMLILLLAFVKKPRTGLKPAMWGVGISGLLTSASTFMIIGIFTERTASGTTYPYFSLVRNISYFDFFQNLDSFVIALWIMGVFIKVSLYLFVSTYGTAQLLGRRNWRKLFWFVAPLVLIMTFIPRDFIESSVIFPQKIAIPYIFPFHMVGMPLLLWGLAKWKAGKAVKG